MPILFPIYDHSQQTGISVVPSQITGLEKELLQHLNQERQAVGLAPLTFSPELRYVAQQHSRDMAKQGNLAHLSSDGATFSDRLDKADLFYQAAGENVAVSETIVVEFIHNALMDSTEHRENILDPYFAQVGIGVYFNRGKFYITQNFLRPMHILTGDQFRREVQTIINNKREALSLPPMQFLTEIDKFADRLSKSTALGRIRLPIPEHFRPVFVHTLVTPDPLADHQEYTAAAQAAISFVSIGEHLAKNPDNPGGAYFITLLLFPSR